MSNQATLEIRVAKGGIHCSGCEAGIESIVSRLPGVAQVKADHRTQLVRVALDTEKTSLEVVREKLAAIGYETV